MQIMFGLDATITSGNKFFDPGDGVTRDREAPFPLYADCKCTSMASMSIRVLHLRQYAARAAELGKRFIMPIRFHIVAEDSHDDWVLIQAHDLAELIDLVNAKDEPDVA
jgi:hypothetical protein